MKKLQKKTPKNKKPHNKCAEYHTRIEMVLQAYRKKKKDKGNFDKLFHCIHL